MLAIRYREVSKRYAGTSRPAVDGVSLEVEEAKVVVLLGPSGCGKTTLLKMTNRLIEPSSGVIEVNGRDIRGQRVTTLRRQMGYVIQQVGLFPHLNVATNVATVPRLLGWSKRRIAERTDELMELVGLEPAIYRRRYPHELSGGQQQRIGLARALAADPDILLMDEPFGAIDAITRARLQEQLVDIQRRVRKTILFVTHDVDEALRLADKLVVMRDGHVLQYDTPINVLTQPADAFVRQLLNTDDVLRELSVIYVGSVMRPAGAWDKGPAIEKDSSLREALSTMISGDVDQLIVLERGTPVGIITLDQVRSIGARGEDRQVSGITAGVSS